MSRIKNMPVVGWVVISVLVTLLVVPTAAVAAGLTITQIEGTSTHVANVTSAGQLLTTEINPSMFRSYLNNQIDGITSDPGCAAVTTPLPAGDALDLQDVSVDLQETDAQTTSGGENSNPDAVILVAARTSDNVCTTLTGFSQIGAVVPQGGNTGTFDLPQRPGYVVPNGYQVYAIAELVTGAVFANGYLIPSSDSPSTPRVQATGTLKIPTPHKG